MTVAVSVPSAEPAQVADLVADRVAARIAAGDSTLWGPGAAEEAAVRLGWVHLHETSRPLLAEIDALAADLRGAGLDRVVLCGMGGSSLAPEVITRTAGVELTVLDTTDPGAVRRALADRLEAHKRVFEVPPHGLPERCYLESSTNLPPSCVLPERSV